MRTLPNLSKKRVDQMTLAEIYYAVLQANGNDCSYGIDEIGAMTAVAIIDVHRMKLNIERFGQPLLSRMDAAKRFIISKLGVEVEVPDLPNQHWLEDILNNS